MEKVQNYLLRNRLYAAVSVIIALFAVVSSAYAGKVKLKLSAVNPRDNEDSIEMRADLPSRVTTNDIISLGGMELRYDVKNDIYYVYEKIEFANKGLVEREIELDDIWQIEDKEITALEKKATELADMLSGSKYSEKSAAELEQIKEKTEKLKKSQAENSVSKVSVIKHIQAYETNLKDLQQAKHGLGQLENYALSAGLNPGDNLSGDDKGAAVPNRDIHYPVEYGTAELKITVKNGTADTRNLSELRKDLPPEVNIDDIIDSNELQVSFDEAKGCVYLHKRDVEVAPRSAVVFTVKIRDKWNVNGPRIKYLHESAEELRITTSGRKTIEAVENTIKKAIADLEAIAREEGPTAFGPAYVVFYRRQADRLDAVESVLNRIEAAIRPLETKKGFDIPAPDKKTTWIIIYSILGFLGIVSMLFLLRWFVKSGSEKG